jgi:GNAT superfamily N-acetyltransferase
MDIELLNVEAADDTRLMRDITELINRVYAAVEDGQWLPSASRTTLDEVTKLTKAGEIVVARLGAGDGSVVGTVRVQQLDEHTGEIGMMAADPAYRQMGVGTELANFARELCRRWGATTVEIELLVPQGWDQPSKQFMAEWVKRRNYTVVRTGRLEERYPELAPQLATPCDFVILRKKL